jgi:hypothetical protein
MIDHKAIYHTIIATRSAAKMSAIKVQPTMIKINGELFFTEKGKSLWKTPGHAKSALRNDMANYFYRYENRNVSYTVREDIILEVMAAAEFISVEISKEMMSNLKF